MLEDGPLKKVLAERHAKGLINKRGAYDDEDDYGVPARQDLKRSKSEPQDNPSEAQRSQSESLSEQQGQSSKAIKLRAQALQLRRNALKMTGRRNQIMSLNATNP